MPTVEQIYFDTKVKPYYQAQYLRLIEALNRLSIASSDSLVASTAICEVIHRFIVDTPALPDSQLDDEGHPINIGEVINLRKEFFPWYEMTTTIYWKHHFIVSAINNKGVVLPESTINFFKNAESTTQKIDQQRKTAIFARSYYHMFLTGNIHKIIGGIFYEFRKNALKSNSLTEADDAFYLIYGTFLRLTNRSKLDDLLFETIRG